MQTSNKTGLVLKISVVLLILLALVVYKLNDYFKNEKLYSMQTQLRSKVVAAKTTVSSQLSQLKNTLSSYETDLNESNINWVQLDPFFAIAKLDKNNQNLRVSQMLARSNTPAERWNSAYLERALNINKSKRTDPILTQLFQDKAGNKFLIIRFKIAAHKELAVVGSADYFQKFFDLERGENSTALLATTENVLAAHSEGDYIASQTNETQFTAKRYLFEKEEIVGTNLIVMNYILKKKIVSGFVVPWSIIGTVLGFGCILIAVLFYSLDPIEKRVERYKKQEREQIYKDTVGGMVSKSNAINLAKSVPFVPVKKENPSLVQVVPDQRETKFEKQEMPKNFFNVTSQSDLTKEVGVDTQVTETEVEKTAQISLDSAEFISLHDDKIDISDIEKALALDDFDSEEDLLKASHDLEKNLTPQKISVSAMGAAIDKPQFALQRKDFKVDEFKTNIRRPEKA